MFVFTVSYPEGARYVETVGKYEWGVRLVQNEYAMVPGRTVTVTAASHDHALAFGEHDRSQCGDWCTDPIGIR